jgi:hypothetical protein
VAPSLPSLSSTLSVKQHLYLLRTLHLVVVDPNPAPGYINNSRGFSDGADLNRVFPGSGAPNCSKIFANRFLHNIVKKFEYLIGELWPAYGRVR